MPNDTVPRLLHLSNGVYFRSYQEMRSVVHLLQQGCHTPGHQSDSVEGLSQKEVI